MGKSGKVVKTLKLKPVKLPTKDFGKVTFSQLNRIGKITLKNYIRLGKINEAVAYAKVLDEAKKAHKTLKKKPKHPRNAQAKNPKNAQFLAMHYHHKTHKKSERIQSHKINENERQRKTRQYTKRQTTPRVKVKNETEKKVRTRKPTNKLKPVKLSTGGKRKYDNTKRMKKRNDRLHTKIRNAVSGNDFVSLHNETTGKYRDVRRIRKTKGQQYTNKRQLTPKEKRLIIKHLGNPKKNTGEKQLMNNKRKNIICVLPGNNKNKKPKDKNVICVLPKSPKDKKQPVDIILPEEDEREYSGEELLMNDVHTSGIIDSMGGLINAIQSYPEDVKRMLNDYLGIDYDSFSPLDNEIGDMVTGKDEENEEE